MDDTAIQASPKPPDKTGIQSAANVGPLSAGLPGVEPQLVKKTIWSAQEIVNQLLALRPRQVLKGLASLRLTVFLLALSILLVFFGTLAQIDAGIYVILRDYFRCFVAWVPLQLFVRFGQIFLLFPHTWKIPDTLAFPFPGGWLIGSFLLANVLAAHAVRFKFTWARSGIMILHAGLIVMMVGELVTGVFAKESRMTIVENGSSTYLEDHHTTELSISSPADAKTDDVIVIPESFLRKGGVIQNEALPFDVEVGEFMVNSSEPMPVPSGTANRATAGQGLTMMVKKLPQVSGTDGDRTDIASAYVTFKEKETGKTLGTYLVSLWLTLMEDQPQQVSVNGKTYDITLRHQRTYKPYTIHLKKFTHDVYEGTSIAKNYSSRVRLVDPTHQEDREVDIFMNNPFRYQGETFYQSGFLPGDRGTILQVVRNPGAEMPYISCIMVSVGMIVHFGIGLFNFLGAKVRPPSLFVKEGPPLARLFPWLVIGLAGLYLSMATMAEGGAFRGFLIQDFGRLPVLHGGRPKPIDTLARDSLMVISDRQTFEDKDGKTQPATLWLLDVMVSHLGDPKTAPEAFQHKVFRIHNPEVLSLLGLQPRSGYRYAVVEFADKIPSVLSQEATRAKQIDPKERKAYEQKLVELAEHIQLFMELSNLQELRLVPPRSSDDGWQTLPQAFSVTKEAGEKNPAAEALKGMIIAYLDDQPQNFNKELSAYRTYVDNHPSAKVRKTNFEFFYNSFQPFYHFMLLYGLVFLLSCFSWLGWALPLRSAAFWVAVLTLVVHTWALLARMYLMDRWGVFVINLYATAIFIGWVSVILSLILEVIFPLGIAMAAGGLIGFLTTYLAHFLARTGGDTLGMLQAVLDTNFWLMTHVTIINIGYAATIVAGVLGIAYLLLAMFTPLLRDPTLKKSLSLMIYGIVCFATLFSFTGTVLGGIWADQSWGRFWGWDPKENGALIIVIWNALILHARWGGLVKQAGTAVLAVVGNMVTLWSWFGTNQLGVGLHAYGFSNTLAMMLTVIWAIHIVFIGLVLGLRRNWASSTA